MDSHNFVTGFAIDRSPEEAFAAINNVRGWWTGAIDGPSEALGDEFSYRYEDLHYSKQKIVELIPGKRVAWLVVDAALKFTQDKSEWTGTKIVFDISRNGDQTEVRFTHEGLVPTIECFGDCSNAWSFYVNESLRNLIATGKGDP